LAVAAGMRGTREHAVLGGDPALALAAQPAADAVLDTGGAQHLGVAETDQHRAFGMAGEVALDADRAQLVRGATTGTGAAAGNHCWHATSTGAGRAGFPAGALRPPRRHAGSDGRPPTPLAGARPPGPRPRAHAP